MRPHAKTAIIAALVGALTATSTAAVAGNGIGAVFNLGRSNTVNAPSSLAGATAGKQLIVANFGTASSSSALLGYGKGAAPAGTFQNAGSGPALSLLAATGQPPFTTNSAYKVANLNADKLDGVDSTGFASATPRTQMLANRIVAAYSLVDAVPILTLPGLGTVKGYCLGDSTGAEIVWENTTSTTIQTWSDFNQADSHFAFIAATPGEGAPIAVYAAVFPTYQRGSTLMLGTGVAPNPRLTATILAAAYDPPGVSGCDFQAQATVWSSP